MIDWVVVFPLLFVLALGVVVFVTVELVLIPAFAKIAEEENIKKIITIAEGKLFIMHIPMK